MLPRVVRELTETFPFPLKITNVNIIFLTSWCSKIKKVVPRECFTYILRDCIYCKLILNFRCTYFIYTETTTSFTTFTSQSNLSIVGHYFVVKPAMTGWKSKTVVLQILSVRVKAYVGDGPVPVICGG